MFHYYLIETEARIRRQDAERERKRRFWQEEARANRTLVEGGLLSRISRYSFRFGSPAARDAIPAVSPARTTLC